MNKMELLRDTEFQNGFRVFGKTHEDGIVGDIFWDNEKKLPDWRLAQWECRYNIVNGKKEKQKCFETSSQRVALISDSMEEILELQLHASKEYAAPRIEGQAWPHLLIEQRDLENRCPTLDRISKLQFTSEVKIDYCRCRMEKVDESLHAAQVNLFFTVSDRETGDMYWFGIPYFDSRFQMQNAYMAEDGGKEDASHKFIYIMAQDKLTTQSFYTFEWIRYQRDIYPDIVEGLKLAKQKGLLQNIDLSKYTLTSMNFGWEMPGVYDGSLLIRKLSIITDTV